MRFHFIAKEKANFSICRMCKVLRVSESGHYAWVSRPASQRQRDDRVYLAHIRAEHARNYRAYGRKRMTDELRDQGIVIGERRVGRLMRENDIRIVRTHKFKRTTNSNHNHNIAPNLLDGDFQATGPNQKWAGDISYLWTAEGWLYLAVIIDLYSRRVIGRAVSDRLKRDLPIKALKRAIALRQPPPGQSPHVPRKTGNVLTAAWPIAINVMVACRLTSGTTSSLPEGIHRHLGPRPRSNAPSQSLPRTEQAPHAVPSPVDLANHSSF